MKKTGILLAFIVVSSVVILSCAYVRPLDIPFGQWENTELGLTLEICPDICVADPARIGHDVCRFPGTYMRDGELIEIRISFQHFHGGVMSMIYRYPAVIGQEIDTFYWWGEHRVVGNRLYLGRGGSQIVLDRVLECEVDKQNEE